MGNEIIRKNLFRACGFLAIMFCKLQADQQVRTEDKETMALIILYLEV